MEHATDTQNAEVLAIAAEDAARPNSVVAPGYKLRYAERALASKGRKTVSKKVQARSCGDWLALELAERTVSPNGVLRVADFEAILDANGVEHRHWNRTTKGWQGRLRMTGRLSLQRVVANEEQLFLPDGSTVKPPRSWIAKHQH